LVLGLGNVSVLNGTKSPQHMQEDWKAVTSVKNFAHSHPDDWDKAVAAFRKLIGQPKP
jgi:hypothetical protein